MVKFIKKIIEKLKLRKLNKLGERLALILNNNAEAIISWAAKMFAAEGWRLIHTSEMEEILAQIDRAEENAAAALKKAEEIKITNASARGEMSEIITEFFYGPQGGDK